MHRDKVSLIAVKLLRHTNQTSNVTSFTMRDQIGLLDNVKALHVMPQTQFYYFIT